LGDFRFSGRTLIAANPLAARSLGHYDAPNQNRP